MDDLKENVYIITRKAHMEGVLHCYGAKNLVPKVMIAALLTEGHVTICNVPNINEIVFAYDMIKSLGCHIEWDTENNVINICAKHISNPQIQIADSRKNRLPILFLSVLAHRCQYACAPHLGGDQIGNRPVDFHIAALEKFGNIVQDLGDKYEIHNKQRMSAAHIYLPYPSVGATENCLFMAVLAKGSSMIHNAAIEPEIMELIGMLRAMGAIIFVHDNRIIEIIGVSELHGTKFFIFGDRIEAAGWAALACASNSNITVTGIHPSSLGNFFAHYRKIGGGITINDTKSITFFKQSALTPTVIETAPYPGFSTDWQQTFGVLLTQADGISIIHETVYEDRFGYLKVLNLLGANTQVTNKCLGSYTCRYKGHDHMHSAIIVGKTDFHAVDHPIMIPDIRAGLSYVIAALIASGTSVLKGIHNLERGYGDVAARLSSIGAQIQKDTI